MSKLLARCGVCFLMVLCLVASSALPAPAASRYLVFCLGDDLSYGTYPDKLKSMLSSPSAYDYDFDVIAHVAPGRTASGLLSSMKNDGWLQEDPNCVLIMVGTNDILKTLYTESDVDKVARDAVAAVQEIVDYVASNTPSGRPTIIVSTIPPSLDPSITQRIDAFNLKIRSDIQGADGIVTDNWEDLYDPAIGEAKRVLMRTDMYPNVAGNWEIAENFYREILTLINPDLISDPNHY